MGRASAQERPPATAEQQPCAAAEVTVVRAFSHPDEMARLRLTDCEGAGRRAALPALSRLARPHGVAPEGDPETTRRAGIRYVAPGIPRLDPGLLTRLATLARRWPNRRILIVSGVRPRARSTSRHRVGRALDVVVEGVPRRRVSEFARGLGETGVGYYPNSTFTHIDVRRRAAYWVDLSGPGERPRYVRSAPVADPQDAQGASEPAPVAATDPATYETSPVAVAVAAVAAVADVPATEADAPRSAASRPNSMASVRPPASSIPGREPTIPGSAAAPPMDEPPLSAAEIAALRRQALRDLDAALAAAHVETATREASSGH